MAGAGLMQDVALTVNGFLEFAARWHPRTEIVGCRADGGQERTTYSDLYGRAMRLSAQLDAFGIRPGDRVATIAMNHIRHLEAWYGIMGIGAVCHTINPRLFRDRLVGIINHAGDRLLLVDASFGGLAADLLAGCPAIEQVIIMPDGAVAAGPSHALDYDEWLDGAPTHRLAWGGFAESLACGLCYTSGTTGEPKGVLYSHRSNYLHALMSLQHDVLNLSAADVVLSIVPMFHANAWGLPFSVPAVGAKFVLPGARLDGASIHALILEHGVTFAGGVPTVWQGLLQHLAATGGNLGSLRRILVGGSACPPLLIRTMEDRYGVEVVHAWGMTETSPIASVASPTAAVLAAGEAVRQVQSAKQGRALVGLDLMLHDEGGAAVPHDGETPGHLMVRGATVVRRYFRQEQDATNADGWFDTGDIATIDGDGFIHITDRAKDLIKSGGEWISSIEIENIVMGHPAVARAAAVAVPHERWGERPLLLVELLPDAKATPEDFRAFLEERIARWWMPDEIRLVEEIPLGATGKIDKKLIRATLCGARA
jgi:fatty-acyl-CoA synthase